MLQQSDLLNIEMVEVPKGEILLRDDRIKAQWLVKIEPFLLGKWLVTQKVYQAVTGESPSSFRGDQLPVETVSWRDAVAFCNALSARYGLQKCYAFDDQIDDFIFDHEANGYRLPTEAEWEYACKAGDKSNRYGELNEIAWYKDNAGKTPHDVGLKKPNALGLYDMLGNVWEWCTDVYDGTVYGSYRIIRGGGWCDEERSCLATNRRRSHPRSFKIDDLGFRIARNL
ncbi:formylglycine-generating enzyme family protein [Pedobacter endophyticus]|uniref:SUMF1/EgtB/PvdO family nonheme iron enzyme n=1 Tax=Pedobacter endophyticus TaxID=2789740 RepID=A0A7S9KZF3_9SPHI|nr:SUMF1/EgtB/PvdO family nonheme iron enzyme [Pedobacter endophyticus]QPH39673.1 SUMF1/EgtB/PvdO family nonheme iron enzyme [Pedobacter endophyticus]